jgi:hypothetical protein
MLTKKLLTLGMTLTLMSPIASYAKQGTETSGGGDAVYVNDQMVIRDLLVQDQVESLKGYKFLDSVPEFKPLIHLIAKANPRFASAIISDLSNAKMYMSPGALPILPYDLTTIAGKGADVQLAIRNKNEILFSRKFLDSAQKEYILIHEALHGILSDNSGPLHHQRVRNIVKYIYDNKNNLDANDFKEFLRDNNFESKSEDQEVAYVWNDKANASLRCYYASETQTLSTATFEKINCGLDNDERSFLDQFLNEKYPELAKKKNSQDYYGSMVNKPYAYTFTLRKDPLLFDRYITTIQMKNCSDNPGSIESVKKGLVRLEDDLATAKYINEILADEEISELERAVLPRAMGIIFNPESFELKARVSLDETKLLLESLKTQQKACEKQYPKLFK